MWIQQSQLMNDAPSIGISLPSNKLTCNSYYLFCRELVVFILALHRMKLFLIKTKTTQNVQCIL